MIIKKKTYETVIKDTLANGLDNWKIVSLRRETKGEVERLVVTLCLGLLDFTKAEPSDDFEVGMTIAEWNCAFGHSDFFGLERHCTEKISAAIGDIKNPWQHTAVLYDEVGQKRVPFLAYTTVINLDDNGEFPYAIYCGGDLAKRTEKLLNKRNA